MLPALLSPPRIAVATSSERAQSFLPVLPSAYWAANKGSPKGHSHLRQSSRTSLASSRVHKKRLRNLPTSSFAKPIDPGGERFAETNHTREGRLGPGPSDYSGNYSSFGKQINAGQRTAQSTTFHVATVPSLTEPVGSSQRKSGYAELSEGLDRKLLQSKHALQALATMWDEDRDGKISSAELTKGLESLGIELGSANANLLFRLYDTSGDGSIDMNELNLAVQSGGLEWDAVKQILPDHDTATATATPRTNHQNLLRNMVGHWQLYSEDADKPMWQQLKYALAKRGTHVIDLFNLWDIAPNGILSKNDFAAGVKKLGLRVQTEDIDLLYDAWDKTGRGELTLMELNTILRRGGEPPKTVRRNDLEARKTAEQMKLRAKGLAKKLRHTVQRKIQQAGDTRSGSRPAMNCDQEKLLKRLSKDRKSLIDCFNSWDTDGDGHISRSELHKALPAHGIVVDKEIVDALFDTMDYDNQGRVPVPHVEKALKWASGSKRSSNVIKFEMKPDKPLHEQIRQALMSNAVRVIDLFREWDEDGDGELSRGEFGRALPLMGINPPREDVDKLFDSFDTDGGGTISFREFNKQLKQQAAAKGSQARKKQAKPDEEEESLLALNELKREVRREFAKLKPGVEPLLASAGEGASRGTAYRARIEWLPHECVTD